MESIENSVIKVLQEESSNYTDNEKLKGFIQATEQFKTLIKKGYTEPRGNNLLSVEEAHLKRCVFNAAF